MHAPEFWGKAEGGLLSALLAPIGSIYGSATARRLRQHQPWRAPVKVICVGNLVAGGAGKTPVALDLGRRLLADGKALHFLTSGYGGSVRGLKRADRAIDDARHVGDESLLLAELAPTWIGRDRAASARAAVAAGAGILVMDDGFQNPALAKDMSLVVVDGGYGFGNGRLIPAGPLRETLEAGLARAHAVVVIDRDDRHVAEQIAAVRPDLPLLHARYSAGPEADLFRGRRVVAFSGIARPEKFFVTLRALGCEIVQEHSFPDHYLFTEREIDRLKGRAKTFAALLVTTAKDAVRLTAEERKGIYVLTIVLRWEDAAAVDALLGKLEA